MLNILILIEPTKYSYHIAISNMIQSALQAEEHSITILDINTYKYDHECLNHINSLQPDVLITLDLSGFRFRTQAGEIALNMMTSKNLNLIWGNKAEYSTFLRKKISLSMLFYDVSGTDGHLMHIYPNLLYYKALEQISYSTTSKDETTMNQKHFLKIWNDFLNDTLL